MSGATRSLPERLGAGCLLLGLAAVGGEPGGLPAAEIEEFLRTARIVETEEVGAGVTRPKRITLTDGERTLQAVWKTIDEYAPVKDFHDGRPVELDFRDSWKHEIAAYEIDKLLGARLVPPTVARRIRGVDGAVQLWIEDAMTETDRLRRGVQPTDRDSWNRQVHAIRLLRQLTHDTDFNNTGNLLVGEGFRLWAIDHSRAFKIRKKLLAPGDLVRFPADLLGRLRRLEAAGLKAAVGGWLTERQRAALLSRRDLIVQRADLLVARHGAEAVLLP